MKPHLFRTAAASLLIAFSLASPSAQASDALLQKNCGACHSDGDGGLTRISGQRKTPEGWLMTIVRMRQLNGAYLTLEDQQTLVKYLSDTQGLAPSETLAYRYGLDRNPNWVEDEIGHDLNTMCARCHTVARFALHRMTPEEWELNLEMHMGQNPTIEYQSGARDRDWYEVAKTEVTPHLADTYRFDDPAWDAWQAADKISPDGDWVVLTDIPGIGPVFGRLNVNEQDGAYQVSGTYMGTAGESLPVSGKMNFYSGFEWRANVTAGDYALRQILFINPETQQLEGRQFFKGQDSLGSTLTGAKAGNGATVLGTVPEAAPAGTIQAQVVGVDLSASDGVELNDFGASAEVSGKNESVSISVGESHTGVVNFYESIDSLRMEPEFTLARVGGGGEAVPAPVPAYFKAIAYWNGADGEAGTDDDIRIGAIDAEWSVGNHNEAAVAMNDAAYAGIMDAESGVFMPAVAGPNPERKFSTNNAGELSVHAHAAGKTAEGQLIVTVQRFIDPPIR